MPTRDTAPLGAPCWTDLMTPDTSRARDFYSSLFGWEAPLAPIQILWINLITNGLRPAV